MNRCSEPAQSRLVIGLMSGTSADGIDAALTRITGCGLETRVEQLDFLFTPFPEDLRSAILRIAGGGQTTAGELCRLKTLLGIRYADACVALCRHAGVRPDQIGLVGCHGQTLWHIPRPEAYLGTELTGTLQIGEDACIAQRMGCPVVGDFRVRDMAAGGQGAPLVPYSEFLIYRRPDETVALQNIGGIGNLTILPAGGTLADVVAFDTGPGNMVMDALTWKFTDGAQRYDRGGALAASAQVSQRLLDWMLDDPYLQRRPPKTTGRERYGPDYVRTLLEQAQALGVSPVDTLATATCFTARTIALALRQSCRQLPQRLIVGGGGAWNDTLMSHLRELLPGCRVMTNEALGYSSDAKEAVAFAVLANEAYEGMCNNVPSATGAEQPVVMGKLSR
ncbi:MAG: anhydro-N-acetylmuramic acid kinase [Eubacteriales bacterium]|nr:anhydro-N-acetylmuramic acid kinase [Eubacteriales bacterium]